MMMKTDTLVIRLNADFTHCNQSDTGWFREASVHSLVEILKNTDAELEYVCHLPKNESPEEHFVLGLEIRDNYSNKDKAEEGRAIVDQFHHNFNNAISELNAVANTPEQLHENLYEIELDILNPYHV